MERTHQATFAPNCWLAPDFDPIKMVRDLERQLNGRGGHIDQTHLYLDPLSAACWCTLVEQDGYSAARAEMPLERAATQIARCAEGVGLDLIGLGVGDGKEPAAALPVQEAMTAMIPQTERLPGESGRDMPPA